MPILTIDLPEHLDLESRAAAAGWDSVEAYVRHLVEQEGVSANGHDPFENVDESSDEVSFAEWKRKFQTLLSLCKASNPNFDDSRESIYPVRK